MLAGCAHLASSREKRESFQPFQSVTVAGAPLSDFLRQRSGVLISGAQPVLLHSNPGEIDLRLRTISHDGFDVGSITAIAADGYYLTASHCVPRQPLYVVLDSPGGPKVLPARLVWRAPSASACDLAVIKTDTTTAAFAVLPTDQIRDGLAVVTTGANGLAAGKIADIVANFAPQTRYTPQTMAIVHTAPLNEGDSGGPLTTLDGKLLGVQVLARGDIFGHTAGIALRPDPAWLDRLIAVDRAATRPAL